jgi:diguanylate cyclase (GGDEF)-like protein/PAS domain S-box-containing protein
VLLRVLRASGRSPVRLASALTAAAVVWFVVRLVHPVGPAVIGWSPALLVAVVAAMVCCRVARHPGTPYSVARFWVLIGVGVALVGAATAVRSVHSLDPGSDIRRIGTPEMLLYLAAVVVGGWALLGLPLGVNGARQRWRFWLDLSTVMVSAALLFWYVTMRSVLGAGNEHAAMITGFITSALTFVAVFAVVKVILTGVATIEASSLRALGLAMLVGVVGSVPEALLPATGPSTGQVVVPVTCLLAVIAADRQRRAAAAPTVAGERPRRSFSLLPYGAVAFSSMLLMYVTAQPDRGDRLVAATALLCLVALVVSRQVLAFTDNSRLLRERDAGLAALAAREQRFGSLVRNSSDFITITGPDGIFTYVSPGAQRMLGLDPDAWTGRAAADIIHPDDLTLVQQHYATIVNQLSGTTTYDVRLRHADRSWRWVEVSNTNLTHDPAVGGIVGNARDITDERAFQQRLQYQAHHDALTGLANRTLFHQELRAALSTDPSGTAVLLVDLNDFKTVNDTFGHSAGDALITVVGHRLRDGVATGDAVARLGGDEFAVLLHDSADKNIRQLVHAVLNAFTEPVDVAGYRTRICASIGVALADDAVTAEELMRRADVAMYAAKADRDGADSRWTAYTAALDTPLQHRATLQDELRAAIDEGQLRLLYQPIIAVAGGRIAAVEALVRWDHPQRGLLSPVHFVPMAEDSDLILALGRWVLTEACSQASRWYAGHGRAAPTVSVNVSARQLHDPTFVNHLQATLATAGLPPSWLTVEITETAAVHPQAIDVLHDLHQLGVRVSLDDFGTGQSSLSLLQSCPADEIKLDRSFTRTALAAGRRSVAVAVIEMATALGLDVVAEGVETAEEAEHLIRLGYHHLQGFHYAYPDNACNVESRFPAPDMAHRAAAA